MKRWAPSHTFEPSLLELITACRRLDPTHNLSRIDDSECDDEIVVSALHDGTVIFTQQVMFMACHQITVTHTHAIGKVTCTTDYVVADMNYGRSAKAQRDTIRIRIRMEDDEEQEERNAGEGLSSLPSS